MDIQVLKNIPLFSELSPEELRELLELSRRRRYPRGSIVFYQEDVDQAIYLIVNGKVKVVLFDDEGKEIILSTLTSGNYDGTYDSIDWINTAFDEVVIAGATLTVNGGGMPAMTYNSPWDGFITFGDSYVLPGNNGFFAGIEFTALPEDDGGMFIGVIR